MMNKKLFVTLSLLTLLYFLSGCGGGGGGGSISAPPPTNPGVPSVIKLLDVQNVAQIGATVYLKAKILDGSGKPVVNYPVYFAKVAGVGTLSVATSNTDSIGVATVTLHSALPGFSSVICEVGSGAGQVRDGRTVYFSSNIKLTPALSLAVNSVPGDTVYNQPSDFVLFEAAGDDTVEVLATVFDIAGFPVGGGWPVSWFADQAEAVFVRTEDITNMNGQAKAVIQVVPDSLRATDTHVNVGASAGNGAFNMVTLFLKPVIVSSVVVTADPTTVASGGTSTITATVTTNLGTPVPDGTMVNFTSTGGSSLGTPFAQTVDGVATTQVKVPTAGEGGFSPGGTDTLSITVTARVGGVSGSATVTATAEPPTPTALTATPTTQPVSCGTAGVTFFISGGTGPYTATSLNPTVLPNVPIADNVLTAIPNACAGLPPSTAVSVVIQDSATPTPNQITVTVTVTNP